MSFYTPAQKFTKKDIERFHAQKRLSERFGLPKEYVSKARRLILNGESEFIKAQSKRVQHHRIRLENREMIAVYDKKRKEVVTFMFPDKFDTGVK